MLLITRPAKLIELLIAAAILTAAIGTWFARDHIEKAIASVAPAAGPGKEQKRGRGKRGGGTLPVVVARVGEGRDDVILEAIGTARAKRSVMIYAPVAGEVMKSESTAEQKVTKGAVIFELDARQARLAHQVAQSKRLDAERKLSRALQLRQRKVGSLASVDDAQTQFDRADLEWKQAAEILGDLKVRAPFEGILGISKVEPGDRVTPATPLVTLDDRSELIVEFDVPEQYLPRLGVGRPIAGRTPGFPREVFAGAIQRIDSRVDPVARSVRVRAAIPNGTDKLRPGMSFVVELNLPGKPYWKVPELALQFSQTGNHVWVVENGRARKVEVTLVKRLESAVLVDGAIPQGGLVVIEGVQRIRDGAKVEHGDTGINTGTNTAATPANTSTAPVRKSREAGRRQGGG